MTYINLIKVVRKRDINGNSIFRCSVNDDCNRIKAKTFKDAWPRDAAQSYINTTLNGNLLKHPNWVIIGEANGFNNNHEMFFHIERVD